MAVLPTGIGPVTGYNVERSLRFNSADSAYLNRTPASASNRRTWTWSGWVKLTVTSPARLFAARVDDSNRFTLTYNFTNSNIDITNVTSGVVTQWGRTNALLRDPSAWYHFVVAFDSTQATATNRLKFYVNSVEQTYSTDNRSSITQNYDGYVNNNIAHYLGTATTAAGNFSDCYLTEVNFIDGQALTPSSFGETDTNTGVWKPKAFSGTYGTNGFFLKFADNSNTTAATLGKDSSGNGNNWTPNNFSVTAGAGNDSLVDSPTSYGTDTGAGGEVRGNYCTWNPLAKSAAVLLSNGNLNGSSDASQTGGCSGTIAVTSGKWYWETTIITFDGASSHGILKLPATNYATSEAGSYKYLNGGDVRIGDGSNTSYGASYGAGDVVGVALDLDNGKVFFSKNGVFQNSGNPVSGTNPAFSSLSGEFTAWCQDGSFTQVDTWATNFGQRAFAYTAPSGFKALCTQNLPTPTIGATSTTQANDYFNAVLYTGNNSTTQNINVGLVPDFVWIKSRTSGTGHHSLIDRVRGDVALNSNQTIAEYGVAAFNMNTDGTIDVPYYASDYSMNTSANNYVAWNWKANGAGSSNTAGTITSTVSANTTSGFSIVTYTGTGANATVGHGLGVAPRMVIVKARNSSPTNWGVYHANSNATPQNYYLLLQSTVAATADSLAWNNTAPTSSVFSLGAGGFNINTATHVAYCFAPVAGYSAFGSYTGNGSADGPFVYTGFRPRYVMVKKTTGTVQHWYVWDSARSTYNLTSNELYPSTSSAETSAATGIDVLSNGFKIRDSSAAYNSNGDTVIYAAFAEHPFKYSLAR